MMEFPVGCPRGLYCKALSRIMSDSEESFICCGALRAGHRRVDRDIFRVCFKNASTDTMLDHDERDIADTISVLAQAMSADWNRQASGKDEDWYYTGI